MTMEREPTAVPTKGREAGARAIVGERDSGEELCELAAMLPFARRDATACLRAFAGAHGLDAEGLRRAAYFIQMHGDYRTSGRDYAVADLLSELSALLAEGQPR